MANTESPKINLHITIPKKMYDKLKRDRLINEDRIANVNLVWFSDTLLDRMHMTVTLADSEPYMHIATCEVYRNEVEVDVKTSPL